jgi:hypothetical protein
MEIAPYYKLIGHEVVPEHDENAYWLWRKTADRIVFHTELHGHMVTTVFHGIIRLWFETTVVRDGDWNELWSDHAWSWEEAKAKHEEAIEYVESELVA